MEGRRCYRCPTRCVTGSPRRAQPLAFSSMRQLWTLVPLVPRLSDHARNLCHSGRPDRRTAAHRGRHRRGAHQAEPDETIMRIVAGWPRNFDARRALDLGFRAEADFDEIIRVYIEDELNGRVGAASA